MQISFAFLLFTYFIDSEPIAVGSQRERGLLIQESCKALVGGGREFAEAPGLGECFVP